MSSGPKWAYVHIGNHVFFPETAGISAHVGEAGVVNLSGKAEKLQAFALDSAKASQLWTMSEEMANVKFEL